MEKCADCGNEFEKGQMRIYWKGKNRCEKCDKIFTENQNDKNKI